MIKISKLKFGILSPEEIKNIAVKAIDRSDVYDADGYPVEGGVMDPKLGVIDPGMVCRTCGGRMRDCLGHFGYMELAKPVVHVLYVKRIKNFLKMICGACGSVVIEDKKVNLDKVNRPDKCPSCGAALKKIKVEKPYSFYEGNKSLKPTEVRKRLEKIPDRLLKKLGVQGGRPEWLVLTTILVPPVTIRPSITLETGERSEDDLTHKLVDIIRINQRLKSNIGIGAPEFIIEDLWELLQYHVSTLFDNTLAGVPPARHRSGRSLKSLSERLMGKEGRFRHNLIGKRANFSARTVISPDPNIDINDVGVPEVIAKELTVPVKVKPENLKKCKNLVKNGLTHPGVNYIIRKDGTRKKLTEENKEELLEEISPGYIIERHLIDGDVVLFNRQPSLHRMSMMAHTVRVMPYSTFRLNLAVCSPYNADFDGDEMNLHVPQTPEAQTEALCLLKVENHIKSPKFGGPIIGLIQDHISGIYMLSQSEISRELAFDLLVSIGALDKELPEGDRIRGKDLISLFIPENVTLEIPSTKKEGVVIKNGKIISGAIDSKAVGAYGGELINQILLTSGKKDAVEFINKVGKLGIAYLERVGLSMSTSDLKVSDGARKEIEKIIANGEEKALKIIEDYKRGNIEPLTGKSNRETLEIMVTAVLREISNKVEGIIKRDIGPTSARIMMESGARGSMTNLALMSGLLGQETVRGGRIERGFTNRTTSHFKAGDLSPKARGFVRSSLLQGLDPIESFYDIMSQREGLMDTSLRTRTSGYMYRRISNAMQDLRVTCDGSVRNATEEIIQFKAGEDGIDPSKSDKGGLTHGK